MFLKKSLAILVCFLMLLSILPFTVGAQEAEGHIHSESCCEPEHLHTDNFASKATDTPDEQLYSPGDLNADGDFNSLDLVITKNVLTGAETDDVIIEYTDCSGDYSSDLFDLVRLKKHIAAIDAIDFEYEIIDGEVIITRQKSEIKGAVTIPSEIEGLPVTAIGNQAFENYSEITSVLIPPSVREISYRAFKNCTSLYSLALPHTITDIGKEAFEGCIGLTAIKLSNNITVLSDGIFRSCELLEKIKIPERVEEIGSGAFLGCCSLIEMNLPKSITILNEGAFSGCSQLMFINMPENLKEIKAYTFYGCEKLQSVTIPITVVNVGDRVFENCSSLLSIVVPYETAFGENVFLGCDKLVVEGLFGSGGIDAAINSGVDHKLMECGHSDFILLYAKNPNCQTVGYSGDKYCIKCGKIEEIGFEIPQTAHATELVNYREVTCERNGFTGDTYCTTCDTYLSVGRIVYSTGHYAKEMPGYVAATCEKDGIYGIFTCQKCNQYINNLVIPAKGHKFDIYNKKAADCLNDGYSGDKICYVCDYVDRKGEVIPKGNHNYELINEVKATCTTQGYSGDRVCSGCKDVKSKGHIITKEHTPISENYKAATCTEKGYSGDSYCLECKEELSKGKELPILGHKSVLINYKEPTCEENGYSGDQICSVCKVFVSIGKAIEKTGHKLIHTNKYDCTESKNGYTGDWICEICKKVVEKGNVIPANHKHSPKVINAVEPSCETEGYSGDSKCEDCGYIEYGEILPVVPHVCETTTVNPTCKDEGYTLDKCKNCKYENKYNPVPALGHDWSDDWKTEKEPTCTEEGEKQKKCTRCDNTLSETIPAKGHTKSELINTKEATCKEEGYTGDYICSDCGAIVLGKAIEKLEHSFGDWTVRCFHSSAPDIDDGIEELNTEGETPDEYAENYRICTACGDEETELLVSGDEIYNIEKIGGSCTEGTQIIYTCKYCEYVHTKTTEPLGHKYTQTVVAPTCTSSGYTLHTCSVCGVSYQDNQTEPLKHNRVYNVGAYYSDYCGGECFTGNTMCTLCNQVLAEGEYYTKEHMWDSIYGQCTECYIYCSHEGYRDSGLGDGFGGDDAFIPEPDMPFYTMCGICGLEPCHNCNTWDHSQHNCPFIPMGYWCEMCQTHHNDPMECPYENGGIWCEYCCVFHMIPEECPYMGGGTGYWCDLCCMHHMEPWECPYSGGGGTGYWCEMCQTQHNDPSECCGGGGW